MQCSASKKLEEYLKIRAKRTIKVKHGMAMFGLVVSFTITSNLEYI